MNTPTTILSKTSRFTSPALTAVALATIGVLAFRSGAGFSRTAPTAAPIVAVVDVEKVVNDCAEMDTRNKANKAKHEAEEKELAKMSEQLTNINKEMDLLKEDDRAGRKALVYKGAQIDGARKVRKDILDSTRDEENADVLRDVYNKAIQTISQYANQNGISLVVVDDTVLTVPAEGGVRSVTSAIIGRRMLYCNKSQLDITNDILTQMNNDYAANGGGKPAGKATPKK